MSTIKNKVGIINHLLIPESVGTLHATSLHNHSLITGLIIALIFNCLACKGDHPASGVSSANPDKTNVTNNSDESQTVATLLVLPKNPAPGKTFRILATGNKLILKSKVIVTGPSGTKESIKSKTSEEYPYWRIDEFSGNSVGKYKVT